MSAPASGIGPETAATAATAQRDDAGAGAPGEVILQDAGLRYRRLEPAADAPAVCRLFGAAFGQLLAPAHWRWKYGEGPGECFGVVVEHLATGDLVGHMGVRVLPGLRLGAALRMGQVCDVMIHPDHRAGIGSRSPYSLMHRALVELARTGAAGPDPLYLYGFPGTRQTRLGARLGFYRPLYVCTAWRARPARGARWTLRRWFGRHALRLERVPERDWSRYDAWLDALAGSLHSPPFAPPRPLVGDRREQNVREREVPADAVPRIVKNAAWLRWRYRDQPRPREPALSPLSPRSPYTLWLAHRQGAAAGWLVTRALPEPVVVDSLLPSGELAAALAELQHLSPAPGGWASWLAHEPAAAAPTAIHAVEMLGARFHPDWPAPVFQPGDTDVF